MLFLCTHNAGRSQMALGILHPSRRRRRHRLVRRYRTRHPGQPRAIAAMAERGIDISAEYPKPWTEEIVRAADVVVSMGCGDACPVYPGPPLPRVGPRRPGRPRRLRRTTHPRRRRAPGTRADGRARHHAPRPVRRRGRRRRRAPHERTTGAQRPGPPAGRRVPRHRPAGHRRGRLRHRRPAALGRRRRPAAAGELDRDVPRPDRPHPDVRAGLRRPLQPGRLGRRLAARPSRRHRPHRPRGPRVQRRPGGRRHPRCGAGERDVRGPRHRARHHRAHRERTCWVGEVVATAGLVVLIFALARTGRGDARSARGRRLHRRGVLVHLLAPRSRTPRSPSAGSSPTPSPASHPARCPGSSSPSSSAAPSPSAVVRYLYPGVVDVADDVVVPHPHAEPRRPR